MIKEGPSEMNGMSDNQDNNNNNNQLSKKSCSDEQSYHSTVSVSYGAKAYGNIRVQD